MVLTQASAVGTNCSSHIATCIQETLSPASCLIICVLSIDLTSRRRICRSAAMWLGAMLLMTNSLIRPVHSDAAAVTGRLHAAIVGLTGRPDRSMRPVGPTIASCKRPVRVAILLYDSLLYFDSFLSMILLNNTADTSRFSARRQIKMSM